jgi:hypothetical protein
MPLDLDPGFAPFRCGHAGRAYNEAAFRHFLAIDRRRAERSMGAGLLVLVTVRQGPGKDADLTEQASAALFRGLGDSIREVDFAGWFRQGRVAGAVLAQRATPSSNARYVVAQRVARTLNTHLPSDLARRVRVRVIRFGSRPRI